MKALLMHRDCDFDAQRALPWNASALTQDLGLEPVVQAMAGSDAVILDTARKALLAAPQNDPGAIAYRQEVLRDCLANPSVARELYALAGEAAEEPRQPFFWVLSNSPSSLLRASVERVERHAMFLRKLRGLVRRHARRFKSPAMTALFGMLERELTDGYLAQVEARLAELKDYRVLVSASLGEKNEGRDYVLRKPTEPSGSWLERVWSAVKEMVEGARSAHVVRIPPRDEAAGRALSELRDRALASAADALAQSAEHVQGFFRTLRTELAFYVGCLNLHDAVAGKGLRVCFPEAMPAGTRTHRFAGLYDVALALVLGPQVVANTADLDGRGVVLVTGANQGGKSTFLRSVGVAQLMMQCGMFVAAESFAAETCGAVITHYRREEDATLKSGKLDEELKRMSDIVDRIAPRSMLLFNESFAATNEREGSEIARQIVTALLEKGQKVFFVTHLYEFARGLWNARLGAAAFLRAEREPDGRRTFRVVEGEPLETSYGVDLYDEIFGRRLPAQGRHAEGPGSVSVALNQGAKADVEPR